MFSTKKCQQLFMAASVAMNLGLMVNNAEGAPPSNTFNQLVLELHRVYGADLVIPSSGSSEQLHFQNIGQASLSAQEIEALTTKYYRIYDNTRKVVESFIKKFHEKQVSFFNLLRQVFLVCIDGVDAELTINAFETFLQNTISLAEIDTTSIVSINSNEQYNLTGSLVDKNNLLVRYYYALLSEYKSFFTTKLELWNDFTKSYTMEIFNQLNQSYKIPELKFKK